MGNQGSVWTAERLRAWRKEAGLTQAALAQLLDYTDRQIQKLEAGEAPVSRVLSLALDQLSGSHAP